MEIKTRKAADTCLLAQPSLCISNGYRQIVVKLVTVHAAAAVSSVVTNILSPAWIPACYLAC